MKNNKRIKDSQWLCDSLKVYGIDYNYHGDVVTKMVDYPSEKNPVAKVKITAKPNHHEIHSRDKALQVIIANVEKRRGMIISIISRVAKLYPAVAPARVAELYGKLSHPLASRANIEQALSAIVEQELILQDLATYESAGDYPEIFPRARARKRKIIAFLGETNSGKTFNAMSEIANSFTSAYFAPLRLLAFETFEYLNEQGIKTELITGEERIPMPDNTCTSSTIECFNPERSYESVVIDEIQMMDDPDRGSFFIQALVGANCDKVVVTGPSEYQERLESIAKMLGEEIEVHNFKRKTQIKVVDPISLSDVKKNTAIVTFSRRNIFEIRDKLPSHIKSSVIYGALGYAVRRSQAEQFINGETDVLITTDAIGMGLNLPIETVVFTADRKYNGRKVDKISHMLTKQIAGRAGRYKKFDTGYVTATDYDILDHVKGCLSSPLVIDPDVNFGVRPNSEYIETMMLKFKLSTVISNWSNMKYPEGSRFFNIQMIEQLKIAKWLEKFYEDKAKEYYRLIFCPIDFDKDHDLFTTLATGVIRYGSIAMPNLSTQVDVNTMEQMMKGATITLWFAQQFPHMCEGGFDDFMRITRELMEEMNVALHKKLSANKKLNKKKLPMKKPKQRRYWPK